MTRFIRKLTKREVALIGDRGLTIDAEGNLWAHDPDEDAALIDELMQDFRRALKPPRRRA
jgi:hypothetical protein